MSRARVDTHPIIPMSPQDSPLAMLIKDERTNKLLAELATQLDELRRSERRGRAPRPLKLKQSEVDYCRAQWDMGVRRGEQRLYDLATLVARRVLETDQIQLVARIVAGPKEEDEQPGTERIIIEEKVERGLLTQYADHALAGQISDHYRYRPHPDRPWSKLYPRASFLQLLPLVTSESALATRVLTRVKASHQIWNKVCDALFDIDRIAKRDKILNPRSKYVKDVFGIKVLTTHRQDSYAVDRLLDNVQFSVAELGALGVDDDRCRHLELLERKDYLALPPERRKKTGWEAVKNVYRWGGQVFEMQIQTHANYFLEEGDLSRTSHRTFEMQRRRLRYDLEERVPHYADFRRLLKSIFADREDWQDAQPDWLEVVG